MTSLLAMLPFPAIFARCDGHGQTWFLGRVPGQVVRGDFIEDANSIARRRGAQSLELKVEPHQLGQVPTVYTR